MSKKMTMPDLSFWGDIYERIKYATLEVSRDDVPPRNIDLCVTLLTEAIAGAKELESKRYKREAHTIYNLLRIAWPREDAVKKLGEHF